MALMRGAAMGAAGGAVAGGMVEGVGFAGKKMRGASKLDDVEEMPLVHGPKPKEEEDFVSADGGNEPHVEGSATIANDIVEVQWAEVPEQIRNHSRFKELSGKNKTRISKELDQHVAFKAAIEGNPELIIAWKQVRFLYIFRNEPGFLNSFYHVLHNQRMQHHIFEGEFGIQTYGANAGSPRATGMHHEGGVKSGRMRIDPDSKQHGKKFPETYTADVELRNELNGSWVPKSNNGGKTSIFPDIWGKNQTLEEIAYARWKILENKSSAYVAGTEYFYISSKGEAEIHMYLMSDDGIRSSFPLVY
jgi:hypothetical protein